MSQAVPQSEGEIFSQNEDRRGLEVACFGAAPGARLTQDAVLVSGLKRVYSRDPSVIVILRLVAVTATFSFLTWLIRLCGRHLRVSLAVLTAGFTKGVCDGESRELGQLSQPLTPPRRQPLCFH